MSKRKNRRNKKDEDDEPFNPNPDLKDVNYDEECTTVRVITPISFDDMPLNRKPEEKEKRKEPRKESPKEKLKERKKEKKEEKKPKENGKDNGNKTLSGVSGKLQPLDLKDIVVIQISVGSKKGHPWEKNISGSHCLVANGKPGLTLQLKKGKKYLLKFIGKEGSGYELILTRSPSGGESASCLDGTAPIPVGKEGLVTLNDKCPNSIYYQDKHREYTGGVINVV